MKNYYLARVIFVFAGMLAATGILTLNISAQVEGGAIIAVDEVAGGGASFSAKKTYYPKAKGAAGKKTAAKTSTVSKTRVSGTTAQGLKPKKWDGFVIGDKYSFLNFEVISAAKPIYTRQAKADGASGLVQVEVLIDTNGNVLTARARTGNKALWPEAEKAALESKFNKPSVYGKPARAFGFLVYRFGTAGDE